MPRTLEEIMSSLDDDEKKLLQSDFDRRVSISINKYKEGHPLGDSADILKIYKRLDNLQLVREQKEKEASLKILAIKKCYEKGIDFSLVEDILPVLNTEDAINKKLSQLEVFSIKRKEDIINEKLANDSYRPSSGQDRGDRMDISQLSINELLALESTNKLDGMI